MPPQVQAILNRNCVSATGRWSRTRACDSIRPPARLRGSEDGPVVKIGDAEGSKLLAVLAADAEPHMPPKKQLTDGEIAVLAVGLPRTSCRHRVQRRLPRMCRPSLRRRSITFWRRRGRRAGYHARAAAPRWAR